MRSHNQIAPRSATVHALFSALIAGVGVAYGVDLTRLASPSGLVQSTFQVREGRLRFSVTRASQAVLESGPVEFVLDGADVAQGVELHEPAPYQVAESYAWRGNHVRATNACNGATFEMTHAASGLTYTLELRVYDDGAAFRFLVPAGANPRVADEGTTFRLPAGSIVWRQDLANHYLGLPARRLISELGQGDWVAPPLAFKLSGEGGYGLITEAALDNYSGMALQADGRGGLRMRLGHTHPASQPFLQRNTAEEARLLSEPAAIAGPLVTPWRVVLVAADLNALVNSDLVPNLCPPPDPKLFPKGAATDWVRPGRAVTAPADTGSAVSTDSALETLLRASDLGFEYLILDSGWKKWSNDQFREVIENASRRHVGLWVRKDARELHYPQQRQDFFRHLQELGIAGVFIEGFDHEARGVADLYPACLREAAADRILVEFRGANKPTGAARTWPNELARDAVLGMDHADAADRATADVTVPFTRWPAGAAAYDPVNFGEGRGNTSRAHQIAGAVILSAPLLVYGTSASNLLDHACVGLFKSIPATWDETQVLAPSEIGELAVFARRSGKTWFLAALNGPAARKIKLPLAFLSAGDYRVTLVRDLGPDAAAPTELETPLRNNHSLTIDLRAGGGFLARFQR